MLNRFLTIVFYLLLIAPALPLFGADSWDEPLRMERLVHEQYAAGDYAAVLDRITSLLLAHPAHPLSVLYYRNILEIADVMGPQQAESVVTNIERGLSRAGSSPGSAAARLLFAMERERFGERYHRPMNPSAAKELYSVTEWMLIGPCSKYGPADIDHPFEPEVATAYSAISLPKKKVSIKDGFGYIDPRDYLFPRQGIAYLTTSFRADGPVRIRIYTRSAYRAFINGHEVLSNRGRDMKQCRIVRVVHARSISLMLKLQSDPFKKVRVIITDDNDRILTPQYTGALRVPDEARCTEISEYPREPIEAMISENKISLSRVMGDYCDIQRSREALQWYRSAWETNKDPLSGFLLAETLVELSSGDRGSADYLIGNQLIREIVRRFPGFIPARHKEFLHLIEARDYDRAQASAWAILKSAPRYHPTQIALLRLMSILGHEKEFMDLLVRFRRDYPQSIYLLEQEADFYKDRNRARYAELCDVIIRRRYTPHYITDLVRLKMARGEYDHATGLAGLYAGDRHFLDEMIETMVRKGDYRNARTLLFRESVQRDDPGIFYMLGLLDAREDGEPTVYWNKMLSINPSLFDYRDYLDYNQTKKVSMPGNFPEGLTREYIDKAVKEDRGSSPSRVLQSSRFFILNGDGSSRVLCDDVVYVGNEQGIDRWGEFKIPFRGTLQPIYCRVYYADGTRNDSYLIHRINDDTYVSLTGLAAQAVIRMTYIVDNPVRDLRQSRLFSLPLTYLQQYDEPVRNTSIKISVPQGIKLRMFFNKNYPVNRWSSAGRDYYTVDIPELPPVKKERHDGGMGKTLESYSFSTVSDTHDFIQWYNGLTAEKSVLTVPDKDLPVSKGLTVRDTIIAVYNYVAREIDLQRSILYYPELADNTLYRKRGSVEDKCLLARALLDRLGIKAFIALTGRRGLPSFGNYVFHGRFSDILLVVPLDSREALWLDFSSQYYPCGTVQEQLDKTEALVMLGNDYDRRLVQSTEGRGRSYRFDVAVTSEGDGHYRAELFYHDRDGRVRKLFRNRQYWEDMVDAYLTRLVSSADVQTGTVRNMKDYSQPFQISATGTILRMAVLGPRGIIIQPILVKSGAYRFITAPSRKSPLVISGEIIEEDRYSYELPQGYTGVSLAKTYELKSRFGTIIVVVEKKNTSPLLLVHKQLRISRGIIAPEEYGEFVKFCQDLKNIETMSVEIGRD